MPLYLLADIGGTHSRFALAEPGNFATHEARKYPNREFTSLSHVLAHYLQETESRPTDACLAVAGPTAGDEIRLTNVDWSFSKEALRRQFQFERLKVVNDFTALAMAVPHLSADYVRKLYGGEAMAQMPISVVGPGTGLGVGGLLWYGQGYAPLEGEGGHTGFAPGDALETEILRYALTRQERVEYEHFISGSGLPFLHECLAAVQGRAHEKLKPDEISWRALSGEHDDAALTIRTFCGILGSFAGDQALLLGAHGGVYIGGGIVPQLGHFFGQSPFRERFLSKGRFREMIEQIPVSLLLSFTETALLGAAAILGS